jgi:hypothetical protein
VAAKLPKSDVLLFTVNVDPTRSNLLPPKPNLHLIKEKFLLNGVNADCFKKNRAPRKEKFHVPRSNVSLLKMKVCLHRVYVDCFFLNVDLIKPNVGQNKLRASLPPRRAAPAARSAGPASPAAAPRVAPFSPLTKRRTLAGSMAPLHSFLAIRRGLALNKVVESTETVVSNG